MNLCRCENGHFYDKEKYASCPHCSGGSAADDRLTAAFTEDVTSAAAQPDMPKSSQGFAQQPQNNALQQDPLDLPPADKFADEPTEALYTAPADSPTVPLNVFTQTVPGSVDDDDHTIGIYDDFFGAPSVGASQTACQNRTSAANKVSTPCVGWLVALGGEHIGTDFRLKAGKNFIGRDMQMDVALTEDKSVSRDRHAIVVYEPKAHLYLVDRKSVV